MMALNMTTLCITAFSITILIISHDTQAQAITPKKIYSIAPCHHFPAENRMARKKNLEFKTERKRKHRT
jgi:hypothetical protein